MTCFKSHRRGQSAIEYLMTYGWMLLVVVVAGGVIYSTSGSQDVESVSGFTGADVQVDNFGLTSSEEIQFQLRNTGGQSMTLSEINVSDPSTGKYVSKIFTGDNEIGVGESRLFSLPNISRSDSAQSLEMKVRYQKGLLSNLTATGRISGNLEVKNTVTAPDSSSEGDSGSIRIIDGFEDDDMAEYTETYNILTNQSPGSFNGEYRLETDAAAYQQGYFISENSSGGSLPVYPEPGDRISLRVYMENVTTDQVWMYTGDSLTETYGIMLDVLNSELILENSTGEISTPLSQSPQANSWITLEFDWGSSGDISARWKDENGNTIDELSTTDATYSEGREYLSVTTYIGSQSDPTYIDYITLEPIN